MNNKCRLKTRSPHPLNKRKKIAVAPKHILISSLQNNIISAPIYKITNNVSYSPPLPNHHRQPFPPQTNELYEQENQVDDLQQAKAVACAMKLALIFANLLEDFRLLLD
jgi:hypothetical protein